MTETAHHLLETSDLPPTLNRELVLAALLNSHSPMSAREVYEKTSVENPLNRVTVYRILDLLADKGLVNRISTGGRSYRYCARQSHKPHCHFHCVRCNEVTCLENDAVIQSENALKDLPLHINNIDLRLDGICPVCQAKELT